jgi:hypothetical protein
MKGLLEYVACFIKKNGEASVAEGKTFFDRRG